MSMINFARMQVQGRLTRDPELHPLKDGSSVCRMRIAVNRMNNGEEVTDYIDVSAWEKDAINCAKYLSTGRMIFASGRFVTSTYTGKDGAERNGFEVRADEVVFGPGGRNNQEQGDSEGQEVYDAPPASTRTPRASTGNGRTTFTRGNRKR